MEWKTQEFLNRSIFYVSTTFILTNNNWTTCFDCYSFILRSLSTVETCSPIVISENKCCADVKKLIYLYVIALRDAFIQKTRNFCLTSSSGKRIFNSPKHSGLLWGSSNLLHNIYHKLFARGQNGCSVNLTTTSPLGAEVKMRWIYTSNPTGTNKPLHLPEGHADIGNVS